MTDDESVSGVNEVIDRMSWKEMEGFVIHESDEEEFESDFECSI